MDFADNLKLFASRVEKIKDTLATEEATKMALIVPFFQLLGYDVFNPNEFVPEFVADFANKKGEKVDYAIFLDEKPVILIEAKWCGEKLDNHGAQLFRYFATTKAKFGILTNGIIYRFYTDLENKNLMDEAPFLEFDILNQKDTIVSELKKFTKDIFNIDDISSTASELKYSNEFKNKFSDLLQTPSDDFVRLFLADIYAGQKNQNVIDKFRPILKQSLNNYISEMMNDKIKSALVADEKKLDVLKTETNIIEVPAESKVVTTQEELEAFFMLKSILKKLVPVEDISFKDTESYMSILYKGKVTKWICRLYFYNDKKVLIIPDENKNETKYTLNNIYDIEKYSEQLLIVLGYYL